MRACPRHQEKGSHGATAQTLKVNKGLPGPLPTPPLRLLQACPLHALMSSPHSAGLGLSCTPVLLLASHPRKTHCRQPGCCAHTMRRFPGTVLHIALRSNTAFAVAGVVWPCLASHRAVPALPVASLSLFYGPSCRRVFLYAATIFNSPLAGELSHPSDCCFRVVSSETMHCPPSGHICTSHFCVCFSHCFWPPPDQKLQEGRGCMQFYFVLSPVQSPKSGV